MSDKTAVSRQEAANILNISTRTLDRYTRQKKLTQVRRGRHVLFNLDEIRRFQQKHEATLQPKLNIDEASFIEDLKTSTNENTSKRGGETTPKQHSEENVYKALYKEANNDLKKKEELLQGANYRVGQLEAKLQNMVPLLELKRQKEENDSLKGSLERTTQSYKETKSVCEVLRHNVNVEKYNKRIFTILFFLTLSFFPIFLLIQFLTY